MKSLQSVCIPLLIPAVETITAIGAASYWLNSGTTFTIHATIACLVSAVISLWWVSRSQTKALTRLRQSELRGGSVRGSGLYGGVLAEAFNIIQACEVEARTASKSKAELEARWQVRRRETTRWYQALQSLETPVLITDAQGAH